ncbi:MAG: transglutaminase-like domain-containing protein [Thermoanaerobaculia bacterium]
MKRLFLPVALALAVPAARADETAVYRASGPDARLFDQYDNDGYSLSVAPVSEGRLELTVRVSDAPLRSRSPYPTAFARDTALSPAADRDELARRLASGGLLQADAVERVLLGVAGLIRYDPDRKRRQDPAAVLASRRAHCVGFAELAVDLLRRVGVPARTVQGVLRLPREAEGYDPEIGGAYHRWIEVYYPDRGFVFSDPWASVNGVDTRYVPFARRSLERPRMLVLESLATSGRLAYVSVRSGDATVRMRALAR